MLLADVSPFILSSAGASTGRPARRRVIYRHQTRQRKPNGDVFALVGSERLPRYPMAPKRVCPEQTFWPRTVEMVTYRKKESDRRRETETEQGKKERKEVRRERAVESEDQNEKEHWRKEGDAKESRGGSEEGKRREREGEQKREG